MRKVYAKSAMMMLLYNIKGPAFAGPNNEALLRYLLRSQCPSQPSILVGDWAHNLFFSSLLFWSILFFVNAFPARKVYASDKPKVRVGRFW